MHRILVLTALALLTVCATASAAPRAVVVEDPGGGRAWDARTASSGAETCAVVRQRGSSVNRARFCKQLGPRNVYLYARLLARRGSSLRRWRTVFVVSFASNVSRATLQTPDGPVTYRRRRGRERLLLAVLRGRVERDRLSVVARVDGRTVTLTDDPDPGAEAGGFRAVTERREERTCVRFERLLGRYGPTPTPARGRSRCGDLGSSPGVAGADEVSDGAVVFGVVAPRVRRVLLRRRGSERPLALDAATRTFVAALDEPPRGLSVVFVAADGSRTVRALDDAA